jgi:enoyl-CoA hydratase
MSVTATPVTLEVSEGIATVRLNREHGNAINGALLDGLMTAFQQVQDDPEVRGILLASSGKLFCPGFDLQELAAFDRAGMERFIGKFGACMLVLYTCPKPVVAAIHGHAVAGGCVLALTTDRRVLREGALIGLNEIRVGVPLPFGVAMVLRESVHSNRLEEIALLGRNYSGVEAVETGLAHEVLPEKGFEERTLERLREFASKDARAFGVTKRYLRAAAGERIRAHDALFVREFLDCWFSPETRARIQSIVAELTAGGR